MTKRFSAVFAVNYEKNKQYRVSPGLLSSSTLPLINYKIKNNSLRRILRNTELNPNLFGDLTVKLSGKNARKKYVLQADYSC